MQVPLAPSNAVPRDLIILILGGRFMNTENRYTPPRAAVADIQDSGDTFQEIRIWSAKGRIGRLRYLAYSMASTLSVGAFAAVALGLLGTKGGILLVAAYIAMLVFHILIMIQRSHDMGWSGWMCFLSIIPFVAFIWMFKSGTPGENEYGAPPPPNSTGVKVLAWMFPVFIVGAGILAAIAVPQYQQYVQRAKAAQHAP